MFGFSKSKSRNPRFFCESCGEEVPRDSKKCPKCGRYFASVRCPSCGYVGEEASFKEGCPNCGYSSKPSQDKPLRGKPPQGRRSGVLPFWVYILTAAAFTAVLAALFLSVFR